MMVWRNDGDGCDADEASDFSKFVPGRERGYWLIPAVRVVTAHGCCYCMIMMHLRGSVVGLYKLDGSIGFHVGEIELPAQVYIWVRQERIGCRSRIAKRSAFGNNDRYQRDNKTTT